MSELLRSVATRQIQGSSASRPDLLNDEIDPNQVDLYAPLHPNQSKLKNTALLVDDVMLTQRVTAAALRRAGYQCDIACNGEQAVNMAKENNYNVILMDVALPIMDGVEATVRIRENEKMLTRSRTIIYGLTSNCTDSDLNRYNEAGMDGCFEKGCIVSSAMLESLSLTQQNPDHFVFINAHNVQIIKNRSKQ